MLSDITLGQYIPGNSFIHRLDPRCKLVSTILYMCILFIADSFKGLIISFAFLAVIIYISRIPFNFIMKSVKAVAILVLITVSFNVFLTPGNDVIFKMGIINVSVQGLYFAGITCIRILLLVVGAGMLTYTTSPIEITDGLEKLMAPLNKISVPVHEISMMMTIALRFIPTLIDETDKIMKAQKSRGAEIDTGSIKDRVKNTIPILVPLFINSFKRADELAIAMESRCYRGGEGRTKMKQLKYTINDFYGYSSITALLLITIIIKLIFR